MSAQFNLYFISYAEGQHGWALVVHNSDNLTINLSFTIAPPLFHCFELLLGSMESLLNNCFLNTSLYPKPFFLGKPKLRELVWQFTEDSTCSVWDPGISESSETSISIKRHISSDWKWDTDGKWIFGFCTWPGWKNENYKNYGIGLL
jgi:hypothetical protein